MCHVNVLFRELCEHLSRQIGGKREGIDRQLLFRAGVKSHGLVMRKFVHSSRGVISSFSRYTSSMAYTYGASVQTGKIGDARSDDLHSQNDLLRFQLQINTR